MRMRNEKMISVVRGFALGVVITVMMFATGCASDVKEVSEEQLRIEQERDSLQRVLAERDSALQELEAANVALDEEVETLTEKTDSLSSTAARRIQYLRIVNEKEKVEAAEALEQEAVNRTALEEEIRSLRERIESLNQQVSSLEQEKTELETRAATAEAAVMEPDSVEYVEVETIEAWKPRYIHTAELIGGFGLGDTRADFSKSVLGVNYVFGYTLTERVTWGFGTGVYVYDAGVMIPLYADLRYRFGGLRYRPFVAGSGGVLLNLNDFEHTGAFLNPLVGMEMILNRRTALHLSAGPLVQHAQDGYRASFIVVKAGISF